MGSAGIRVVSHTNLHHHMKPRFPRGLASLATGFLTAITFTGTAGAATYTKADNTTPLDQAGSWGGTAPTAADIANWSGTYNTAGSLSAPLPASSLSWQGITIGALSGTAAGTVSIGGTGVPLAWVSGARLRRPLGVQR